MTAIRAMHFADVHFGVENYGRFDPETGLHTRLIDFRDALNHAIDKALDAGVEIALFAGDAYKSRDPNQTQQREFAKCLGRLTARGVPVVMLAGNHDIPNTRGRANSIEIFGALAGELLHIFDFPEVRIIQTASGNALQVAAMPYLIKSLVLARDEYKDKGVQQTTQLIVDKYSAGINQLAGQCDPALPTVLIGHFSVSNAKLSANQKGYLANEPEVPLSVLARQPFDYAALGHIHRFQDLNRGAQPPVVYCGSIERIDFGERSEDKGFCLADIAKGYTEVQHVVVPTRPFVEITVDAAGDGDAATERIHRAIAGQNIKDSVVKLSFKIRSEQEPALRMGDIRAALSDAFLVAAIQKDVLRDDDAIRSKVLSESLNPLQALAAFFDSNDTLRARKDELTAYAEPLVQELEREEAVQ